MLTLLILLVCVVVLAYWYVRQCHSVLQQCGIPGPRPVFLMGSVLEFKDKHPVDVFKDLYERYGKVFGLYEGLRASVVISDPDLANKVLSSDFPFFSIRPPCNPFLYFPDTLSVQSANGHAWKQTRVSVSAALSPATIRQVFPDIRAVADRYVTRARDMAERYPDGFDITELVACYSLDALAGPAFHYRVDSWAQPQCILRQFMQAYNFSASADNPVTGLARLFPVLVPLLEPLNSKHRNLHRQHVTLLADLVRAEAARDVTTPDNVIQHLLRATVTEEEADIKAQKRPLTETEVLAQVALLVGDGLGPTHACLAFTLHLLALNPEVQDRLYQEIHNVCLEGEVTLEGLGKLEYLKMVVLESLRLFPIAPGVARSCTRDCQVGGVTFRKGMYIRVMSSTLCSDPSLFPQPDLFRPERFSQEERSKRHFCTSLPFGHGPRMCVGSRWGTTLVGCLLVRLLQDFRFLPCARTQVPLKTALRPSLVPRDGVFLTLLPRH